MNQSPRQSPQDREAALFALAVEKPVAERDAFLQAVCGSDSALRQRLDALLAAHEATGEVLGDEPSREVLAPTLDLPEPVPDESVGQTLGRYKLLERVGEGGCGVVYVAEQTEPVRRRVALKVIKLGMDTKQVVARFEAERQALAMMDHPNIAKVLDAGTTDVGRPYFVMELVRGIRITDYCDQANLSTKERLDLFIKVCQAIQHAHQKGIIHRDIKPSNILVTLHDGVPVPKVIDFGIAKATEGRLTDNTVYTQLHQFIGTPAYMSPEQAEMSGLDIDTRSDIYSLGVLLYELLAGSTPFDAKELMASGIDQMRKTIREKEPQRPSTRLATLGAEKLTTTAKRRSADTSKLLHQLKGDLDWIVMKCLEKDRQRRYDTANGLAADLKRHLDNEPVTARPPSAGYKFQKAWRRNKLAFGAATAVVVALVLGCGLATLAFLQKQTALRALIHSDQRRVVERVRYAIQSGDRERTEMGLRDAEETRLPESQLRFLRGLHLVATAQAARAIPELKAVHALEPDNVAALGLLATAIAIESGRAEFEGLIPQLEKAKPVTPDDHLFLGQALATVKPRIGLALMEEAIRAEDSPMARILLAQTRTVVATDTGDLAIMRTALADIAAAEAWARHSLPVLIASSYTHWAAAELYRRAGDATLAEAEMQAAEQASARLESFHPNVQALHARLDHLILIGDADRALELASKWSTEIAGSNFQLYAAWVLLMKGDFKVALQITRPLQQENLLRLAHFMAAMQLPESRAEAEGVVTEVSAGSPRDLLALYDAVSVSFLAGRPKQAQALARGYLQRTGVLTSMLMGIGERRIVEFLAGDISEQNLLKAAKGSHALANSLIFVGLHHLGRRDRVQARLHLQAARDAAVGGEIPKHIAILILRRLDENPNWPPTISATRATATP